ncbi:MAG TPA: hypothetical protein VEI58_12350 [Chthoniobacterales bacterium]|nr:hypothetical protein [Chthoniobacterales bacterium]
MKSLCFLAAVIFTIFAWNYLHRPITYPAGVLIASDPLQTETDDGPLTAGAFSLKPLARFAIEARVLHRKIYRWDRQAALVPVDLALGWGPMSDQRILDQLTITQSMRFYWFEYKLPPPISKEEIIAHSTNLHVIPATAKIASQCKSLRTGALVRLSGDLVEATGPGVGTWKSSLSRTDTGNGACELMWVREVSILPVGNSPERPSIVSQQ